MKTEEIFGIKILSGTREEMLEKCIASIGKGGIISTLNPEIIRASLDNKELYSALRKSVNIPDGIGVKIALSLKGVKTERFPGVELGEEILDIKPLRLAIIGGEAGIAAIALENLSKKHKMVIPTFARDGYSLSKREIRALLSLYSPDVIFVCLGSPKQEIFSYNMHKIYNRGLFISLGGSADIYSERKKRSPKIFRLFGLEWFFRVLREPKRIKRLPGIFGFFWQGMKFREFKPKNYPKTIKNHRK